MVWTRVETFHWKVKEREGEKNVLLFPASGTTTIIFGMEMMFWKVLERRRHDLQKFHRSIFIFFSFPCIIYEWEGKEDHEIELEQRLGEKYDEEKQKKGTYFWTKIFFFTFQILDGRREKRKNQWNKLAKESKTRKWLSLLHLFSFFSHDAACYSTLDWELLVLKEVVL